MYRCILIIMFRNSIYRIFNTSRIWRSVLPVAFVVPLIVAECLALGHNCDHTASDEHNECSLCVIAASFAVETPDVVIERPVVSDNDSFPILFSFSVLAISQRFSPRAPPAA